MQIRLTRKNIAGAITLIISLATLTVMYRGIRTGAGVIPGFSFLLWTLIAIAYSVHEEINEYVKENHAKVTEPLMANMERVKTNILETTRRAPIQPLNRTLGNTRNRLRRSLITLLYQLIQAMENPDDKTPRNP